MRFYFRSRLGLGENSRRRNRYNWLTSTYAGGSGLILVGLGVFILSHGDWLPGALAAACGAWAILSAFGRRGRN